jgi:anti-sigma regulatory factor (Ser/Thr protein kinase)
LAVSHSGGNGLNETHRLVITNQLPALREMSEWLAKATRQLGASEEQIFNFDLCANEAAANIISYAYPEPGLHKIALELSRQPNNLTLTIEDDGIAYNPLARPEHPQPATLDDAEIGGLGIDLIRQFMSECRYARLQGKNQLILISHQQ